MRKTNFVVPLQGGVFGVSPVAQVEASLFEIQEQHSKNPKVMALLRNAGIVMGQLKEEIARERAA